MQPTPVSSDLVPTPHGAPTGETAHQLGIQATVASTEASSLKAEATHASQLGVQILQRHLTTPIGRMSAQSNAHAEVQAKTTETGPVRGLEQPLFPAGADGREVTGVDMAKRPVSVLPVAFPTPMAQGALGGEQANALGVQRGKTATSHADERRVQILQRHPPGPTEQMLQAKMADSPAQAANRENGRQALRQAQGPLTAGPRTELVEVQTPAPTVLVQRQSVAGANVGANIPLPLAIHTNQGNPSMIARQDAGTPGSLNEANSLPAQNLAATPVETPADIDVGELAEQVSRILMRQLDVERERRGNGRWH